MTFRDRLILAMMVRGHNVGSLAKATGIRTSRLKQLLVWGVDPEAAECEVLATALRFGYLFLLADLEKIMEEIELSDYRREGFIRRLKAMIAT